MRICRLLFVLMLVLPFSVNDSQAWALKSTKVPRFDAVVSKAVAFVSSQPMIREREKSLVAYALLKAGVAKSDPHIVEGVAEAKGRAASSHYVGYDHIYLAGIDAMLLADLDADLYFVELQNIANYVQSAQRRDGSWSDTPPAPGDVSMSQYGVLALWAAQRANCELRPEAIESAATWFMSNGNSDGGWGYRPGTGSGPGAGKSTHNMTLAAAGSIAVGRTLLFGRKSQPKTEAELAPAKFGVLAKVESESEKNARKGVAFPQYSPRTSAGNMDTRTERGLGWAQARFQPVSKQDHKIYFYYTLERASALSELPDGWYTTYGDGLMSLQQADGSFKTHPSVGSTIATSFAILYYMRSTQQILDKQFGTGIMKGGRDLGSLFGKKEVKKDIGPLDALLEQMEKADLSQLDNIDADAVVEKIAVGSKEELIGQIDLLKKLLEHPDASNRQMAFFALGRTGDFSLIPEMLKGLRDPSVDVNVEALMALRYISRKPNGFGMSLRPLDGAETADDARKVQVANAWRTKAYKAWGNWYRQIRPYEEGGGFDELELIAKPGR